MIKIKNKTKKEFSKMFCAIASLTFMFIGCWMIWKYYNLVEMAIQMESSALPDAVLPVTGITSILVPFISYLLYQFKLKNSRNKYGINEQGVPYCMPEENEHAE